MTVYSSAGWRATAVPQIVEPQIENRRSPVLRGSPVDCIGCYKGLEVHPQHELQNASAGFHGARDIAIGAGHLPEGRADVAILHRAGGPRTRVAEVGQVEDVQRAGAELDVDLFVDRGTLHHAGIEEAIPVRIEVTAPAELTGGGRSDVGRIRIELRGGEAARVERRQG